jgi:hypothetical protein
MLFWYLGNLCTLCLFEYIDGHKVVGLGSINQETSCFS